MRRIFKPFIAVVVAAGFAVAGCSSGTSSTAPEKEEGTDSGTSAEADGLVIGVSFDHLNEIRQAELAGIEAAAEANGDEVVFVSADSDAQKQATQIQDLIQTKKVDAVIVVAYNMDQIMASVALAKANDVPFIAIDRAIDSPDIAFQITGDPVADGRIAGQAMLDRGEEMNVLQLVGGLTDQNAIGRRDGFLEVIEGSDQVREVAQIPTDWDPTKALDGTANALEKNPEINAIYIPSDYLLPSVQSALENAGRLVPEGEPGHVYIVTIDGDPVGCAALVEGSIDADVATLVEEFGRQAVEAAHTLVSGGTLAETAVEIPGLLLTMENFDADSSQVWGCADVSK